MCLIFRPGFLRKHRKGLKGGGRGYPREAPTPGFSSAKFLAVPGSRLSGILLEAPATSPGARELPLAELLQGACCVTGME